MLKKTAGALLVFGLIALHFGFVEASPEPVKLSVTITLLQDTPLYDSPYNTKKPLGVLTPQVVQIVGAEEHWASFRQETDRKWFLVDTWIGPRWVSLTISQMGTLAQEDIHLWLPREKQLYDSPFSSGGTGVTLSPQTVHVVAKFTNKFRDSYLVETWMGPRWLVDTAGDYYPVTLAEEKIDLPTLTSMFAQPVAKNGDNGMLTPQRVEAFEKYGKDWYHVRTAAGDKTWINRAYAEPENVQPTDEFVDVPNVTVLHKYPYVDDIDMSAISPQRVKAFEKWKSPSGTLWYHIYSWQGFVWIKSPAYPLLDKQEALSLAKRKDPDSDAEWSAELDKKYQPEPSAAARPTWVVTASYPAGNKMIVYIDAETGEQLAALTEIEGGGVRLRMMK